MVKWGSLLLAVAVVALPAPATAGAPVRGMWAPALDARSPRDEAPVELTQWRGRMVLLAFFGTGCPHCRALVPRLNALQETFAAKGLTLVALSPDPPAEIRGFAKRERLTPVAARVPVDTLRCYDVRTYPLGVLVGPAGRILFRGRFERLSDRVLTAYLERVRIVPSPPPAFAAVEADRQAGRLGAVEAALRRHQACGRLDARSCRYVRDTLAWLDWQRTRAEEAAREDEARARWASAVRAYEELGAAYPAAARATEWAAARARLLSDPIRAREIRAAQALDQARRAGRWQPRDAQRQRLLAMVRAHPDTAAAEEARALLELLSPK